MCKKKVRILFSPAVFIMIFLLFYLYIGVQKPGSQYSPAIYTMDIAYKIDIPLFIFDRYITGI